MTFSKGDLEAIQSFDTSQHLYLSVEGKGENQCLKAKERNWFGRLLMKLGWSSSSMSKVADYVNSLNFCKDSDALTKTISTLNEDSNSPLAKTLDKLRLQFFSYSENRTCCSKISKDGLAAEKAGEKLTLITSHNQLDKLEEYKKNLEETKGKVSNLRIRYDHAPPKADVDALGLELRALERKESELTEKVTILAKWKEVLARPH